MTTFALLHGSGEGGWAWHLVQRALRERGHASVAPDLPTERDGATWADCAGVVLDALDALDRADDVVVVGQSAGGFVVPLVAERARARLQVYVAGMVPRPGESPGEWFGAVGWSAAVADAARADGGLSGNEDPMVSFYADVPPALAREALARERPTSDALGAAPWPGTLPDLPSRYVVTLRDRFLPPAVQRRAARERLGIATPDTIDSGHCPHFSRPQELAALLAGPTGPVVSQPPPRPPFGGMRAG